MVIQRSNRIRKADMVKLPKAYLSYSAWYSWNKNKNQFRKRYYENEPSYETRETIFGKKIAEMLEQKKDDPILSKIPRGKKSEFEIKTVIRGIPVLGYLDSFTKKTGSIFENKTGRIPWDQKRVDDHDQLPFYAMCVKEKFGYYDPYVLLSWLETMLVERRETIGGIDFTNDDERDKEIRLTGRIAVFTREIYDADIEKITESFVKTAKEIEEDYRGWVSK